MEFVTKDGLELHLKQVNVSAVQSLLGSSSVMLDLFTRTSGDESDVFERMSPAEQAQALADFEPLMNYCIGWGVTDDPPEESLAELKLLGVDPENRREARVKWLRILVLDQEDAGELMGRVLAFSMRSEEEAAVLEQGLTFDSVDEMRTYLEEQG